jgi:toxin-antitoxin system, toxin component, Txe/YoeB family
VVKASFEIRYTKAASKDISRIKAAHLDERVKRLIEHLRQDPFKSPPPYEKLVGDLKGLYSRRINLKHRLVYKVDSEQHAVIIIRMWTHYEA